VEVTTGAGDRMTLSTDTMVAIAGGEFAMGSDEFYPDEAPVRRVTVEGFSIDPFQVTNDQYAEFVNMTGYVTLAERVPDAELYLGAKPEDLVPGSLVFTMTDGPVDLRNYGNWWRWTPGSQWRHPIGPDSSLHGFGDHPVVHVAYEDVIAYCDWAGGTLPSEAEHEYAARGGLDGKRFAWGDDDSQENEPMANTWQGRFPYENTEVDGYTRTSPVGTFSPNGYGLYDMAGNVWEWTDDWYTNKPGALVENSCCAPVDPRGGREESSLDPAQPETLIPRKVIKGGSHLCTPQYCYRYRPAARQPQMIDTGMSHLGFRRTARESG
jgi:formylglycine-generating enzyme required for sulfatase activity